MVIFSRRFRRLNAFLRTFSRGFLYFFRAFKSGPLSVNGSFTFIVTVTAQFVLSARTVVVPVAQFVFVYSFFAVALALVARVVAMHSAVAPVFGVHTPGVVHARNHVRGTIEVTYGGQKQNEPNPY